ncbi:putative iron ABC transporter, ATP-binding protein [Desulfosarcina variabilis str. Montpellier]|uniref:ABC transporter ATP-binding protein n=1 Tax=Desulfosarcina variabilis TaxID=2300 RepID=UPI003AFB2B39
METLTVEDLSFDYETLPVLRDIDFSVAPGTICGLLGPNGSGKSTLFKCINGLLKPRQGHVRIGGQRIAQLSRRTIAGIMAVVPQQTTVAFAFSALQMVLMGRASRVGAMGRPSGADARDAAGVLSDLGIPHLKNRPFNALSGGERQIVLLARALFQNPSILLLDEPTAHLDFKNQYRVMDIVQKMTRRHHLTTLITLHDPNLAVRYCSQLVMLKQGRVHRQGTTADVFEQQAIEALYDMNVSIQNGDRGQWFVMPGMVQTPLSDIGGRQYAVQ